MASSITVRLEMEDVVVTLDEGREQHRRPEMTPGRICDGCLQKQAIAWHSFYYNGMPYFERRTSKLANVALCADCHVGSQTIDDEELVEQKISAALQPANRRRYESSTKWQAIRRRILERDEGICRFCLSAPAAAIHHFSYANYGNEYFHEVIATCHQCHHGWHVHRNAFYRKRPKAITGTRKKQFPALNRDSWRLSSHTDRSLGSKRSGPAPRSYSDLHPDPVPLHEDLWYCDCKSVICYPHGGPAKRHKVAKGCKQCGDFHKFGYFKKLPPCEPVDIGQRILDFTNARLDAFARNQFANFSWHPAVQRFFADFSGWSLISRRFCTLGG